MIKGTAKPVRSSALCHHLIRHHAFVFFAFEEAFDEKVFTPWAQLKNGIAEKENLENQKILQTRLIMFTKLRFDVWFESVFMSVV